MCSAGRRAVVAEIFAVDKAFVVPCLQKRAFFVVFGFKFQPKSVVHAPRRHVPSARVPGGGGS